MSRFVGLSSVKWVKENERAGNGGNHFLVDKNGLPGVEILKCSNLEKMQPEYSKYKNADKNSRRENPRERRNIINQRSDIGRFGNQHQRRDREEKGLSDERRLASERNKAEVLESGFQFIL